MTIYTVALPKGGTTKTTTAAELVAHLAACGRSVLAIDLDQQANLTTRLGISRTTEIRGTTSDVLVGDKSAGEAATDSPSVPGARVLAGSHGLTNIEHRPELMTALRFHLPDVAGFDDVVIDTPTSLTMPTLTGLAAAEVIVVAVACETEAYDQIGRLAQVIASRIVAPRINPGLQINHLVPTRFDARRLLDRDVLEAIERDWPGKVTTPVREAVVVRDAYTAGMPVSLYAPTSPVAGDYAAAIAQVTGIARPAPAT